MGNDIRFFAAFHFDSYGIEAPKEVVEFTKYNCENCYSSTFQIQQMDSRMCGQYSLWMLYELKNTAEGLRPKSVNKNYFDIVLDLLENIE